MVLAVFSGILAGLTPCIAALYPFILYKFARMEKKKLLYQYPLFLGGFLISFMGIGLFFNYVFSISIQNALKIIFSIILIIFGILEYYGRIPPQESREVENTFIFASIFAFTISINPCTIPFITTTLVYYNDARLVINLLLFGIGLVIPSSLFLFLGRSAYVIIKRSSVALASIERLFPGLLLLSGIYLGLSVKSISKVDIIVISSGMLFIYLIFFYYLIFSKDYFILTPEIFALILASILLLISFSFHCYFSVAQNITVATCNISCPICRRCLFLFSLAAVFVTFGTLIVEK